MGKSGYSNFVINNVGYKGIKHLNPTYNSHVAGNLFKSSKLSVIENTTNSTLTTN